MRKPHIVRCDTIYLDKRKGGLGVKCLYTLNKALLCKWNWGFANKMEALWNQVINGKYGEKGREWCSWEVKEGHGVGFWKAIKKDWDLVSSRISFLVCMGRGSSFGRISGMRLHLYVAPSLPYLS